MTPNHRFNRGFSLVELLAVIGIIAVLASLLLPALTRVKAQGSRLSCANNLRQLALAAKLYATDYDGYLPRPSSGRTWVSLLRPYYQNSGVLKCPADRNAKASKSEAFLSAGPRSYLANGFSDFFQDPTTAGNKKGLSATGGLPGLRETAIALPSDTLLFGEKASSSPVYYLDVLATGLSFISDMDEERHRSGTHAEARGQSNYAFCDGSVRPLAFGKSTCPVNLWALSDPWRTDAALCRPRH